MSNIIGINRKAMEKRFNKCAKGAAAQVIALLVKYGLLEYDLADAMDDIPRILTQALGSLREDIENWPGDYMKVFDARKELMTVTLEGLADPVKKIGLIKVVREITNLDLKDAKELVEGAPKVVVENLSQPEAETIRQKLEEAGGKVSLVFGNARMGV